MKVFCSSCKQPLAHDLIKGTLDFSERELYVFPCQNCDIKIVPVPKAPVRNLIYSVCPFGNWKWNIEQLAKRFSVFTGRVVFGVTTGSGLEPYDAVCNYIANHIGVAKQLEFVSVENFPNLGDSHTFSKLLPIAAYFDRSGSTFYAHTKGVSRTKNPAVTLWTDAMYHYNLDDIEKVDIQLKQFPVTGCCKRYGKFAHFPRKSLYHLSGTFFWFRNKDLFAKRWKQIPPGKYGSESYISLLFRTSQVGCLWGDKFQDGYKWEYMSQLLANEPYFAKFISENNAAGIENDKQRKLDHRK